MQNPFAKFIEIVQTIDWITPFSTLYDLVELSFQWSLKLAGWFFTALALGLAFQIVCMIVMTTFESKAVQQRLHKTLLDARVKGGIYRRRWREFCLATGLLKTDSSKE